MIGRRMAGPASADTSSAGVLGDESTGLGVFGELRCCGALTLGAKAGPASVSGPAAGVTEADAAS